jgi:6-phosphogluconolactonase
MAALHEHQLISAQALANQLALAVAAQLQEGLNAKGHAVLAVSGGKSPIAFFEVLRDQDLAWEHVTITLVDERCVPRDHADSNAALVRRHLLQGRAQSARFIPLVDETGPEMPEPAELVQRAQQRWAQLPAADVVVLGMGDDGHTASLFPHTPALAEGLDLSNTARLLAVLPTVAPHWRVSMTLAEILRADHIALSLGGAAKLPVYQAAKAGVNNTLPVSHVLHAQHPSTHVWMHA